MEYSSLSLKEGKVIKKIEVINPILDADIVINLPKFKTHNLTVITGAVKNMFGVVPGFLKLGYHTRFNKVEKFSDMLVDLAMLIKPEISIMDGILGIEGEGPGMSGSPRKVGLVLASESPVSLDVVMAQIMGIEEELCPTIVAARNRKIEGADSGDIKLLGEELDGVIISDFKLPKNVGRVELVKDGFVSNYILPFLRNSLNPYPAVNRDRCSLCKTCIKVCPENSIFIKGDKIEFNYKKCIRCFCCSEMCPEGAIEIKYSLLGNFILNKLGWAGKVKKA
jgi:ferredoxin